jgi:hypothetical protein
MLPHTIIYHIDVSFATLGVQCVFLTSEVLLKPKASLKMSGEKKVSLYYIYPLTAARTPILTW